MFMVLNSMVSHLPDGALVFPNGDYSWSLGKEPSVKQPRQVEGNVTLEPRHLPRQTLMAHMGES